MGTYSASVPDRWSGQPPQCDTRTRAGLVLVKHLLVIHHSPSPPTHQILEAALSGVAHPELAGVEVETLPALATTASQILAADGYLLGTTANFGYMSGALKHVFDTTYYTCLGATSGRPWGLWVHGNDDTEGAVRSVRRIVAGLEWRDVARPVTVIGPPTASDLGAVSDLAATVAANLLD